MFPTLPPHPHVPPHFLIAGYRALSNHSDRSGHWQPAKKHARKSKKSWLVVSPDSLKSAFPVRNETTNSKKSELSRMPVSSQSHGHGRDADPTSPVTTSAYPCAATFDAAARTR